MKVFDYMTVEELELTADCAMVSQVASTARDLVADLEHTAGRSTKHCAELDYIATMLARLADECDECGKAWEKEAE